MKKFFTVFLATALLFSLVACGTDGTESTLSSVSESVVVPDAPSVPDNSTGGESITTSGRTRTTTSQRTQNSQSGSDEPNTDMMTTQTTTGTAARPNNSSQQSIVTTTQPEKELPLIICWGDSITEGAWMDKQYKYPAYLQEMVGKDNYMVWNAGYGGDGSLAIGARQGAYTVTTKHDITFPKGKSTVIIGHRQTGMGLMLDGTTELVKLNVNKLNSASSDWTYTLNANPVTINGKSYTLGLTYETETQPYKDGVYSVTLVRKNTDSELTIPAGSKVTLANSNLAANSHCDVYLMGANDGLGNAPSASAVSLLVSRYKKLIDSRKNDRYLVIIPYWTSGYDAAFKEAFGDHAVNFRELSVEKGLQTEGLTANAKDNDLLQSGNVPASLRYNNQGAEQVHLNRYGYHFMATVVYEQGKALGYWK